jgi:hypothetical protein
VPTLNAENSLHGSAAHSALPGAAGQPLILLATINAKWIHPSLALRLLKANLGNLEATCEILEFALRQPPAEKAGPIAAARPRILGLSVSIWNHRATVELLRALRGGQAPVPAGTTRRHAAGRENLPAHRPVIVLGGPEVSHLDEDAEIFRYADFVIRGEGETAFRELCAAILEGRPSPGKFIQAPPVNLAVIDSGCRLYRDEDLARKLVYVEASRGCPFGCEFCLSSLDRTVREFPLEKFLADMESLVRRGARTFKFLDRSFNLNTERARRIMEFFLDKAAHRRADTETGRPFCVHFEMVPGRFPAKLRSLLKRFPPETLRLEIGIQTFHQKTAALIGRASDPERELETLRFLREETGAIIHADLIAGLPGEGMASFGEGFDRLWQVLSAGEPAGLPADAGRPGRAEIQLGILKRLPGAPIARHDGPCGMRYDPAPPYEVRKTAALSAGELDRIKNFARFWELIVNRGAFPDLAPALFPPGVPVWDRFMALSDRLLARFGRNWGIDRQELRTALEEQAPA